MIKALISILLLNMVGGKSLNQKIDDYLNKRLSDEIKCEYSILGQIEQGAEINMDLSRELKIAGNVAYLPIEITSAKKGFYKSFLTLKVKMFANVFVAKSDIHKGDEIHSSLFKVEYREISNIRGNAILSGKLPENKISRVYIQEGKLLVDEQLEEKPTIKSGDKITAIATAGSVQISTIAFARNNGTIGDVIQVRTVDNIILRAEIVDENTVLIYE